MAVYFALFFQTAIAVHGQIKQDNKWLTYLYELWLARAPVLGGEYGGWVNGTSYFRICMATLLDVPMIIKNYTGFDFINSTNGMLIIHIGCFMQCLPVPLPVGSGTTLRL